MKKVWTSLVTFVFSVCLILGTMAPASAAALKKVSGLKADATPIAVTLTWRKAAGAKGYEIQQKSGKKWKKVATIKKQKTTTYTVKKLKNGTTYQFRVYAVNGKKKSKATTVKVKTGVQKITGVTAVSTGLKSAKLTWAKGNVTGYEIQRKVGKKWKTVKKIKKAKTVSLNVSNISAAQNNSFRIRGYVAGAAKTYYGAYTTVNVTTSVTPMKNVSVKSVTDKAVTVAWAKLSGVSGYQVQVYKNNKWTDVNTAVKNSVTQYTVSGLSAFANYQIRVRAYQKDGNKTYYNNWVAVNSKTSLGTVSGLSYTGLSADKVTVKWNAAGGAAGYRVFNNGVKVADVKTNSAVLSIKAGTAYKITVTPYNGGTTGVATAAITFTSPCAKVTGVKATAISDDSVTVAWTAASGAQSYQFQYSQNGSSWTSVNLTSTSYTVRSLSSNKDYQFRVYAVNKNGNTTQYSIVSDVLKAKTSGCSSVATTTGSTLFWKEVSGAAKYAVEYYDIDMNSWIGVGTANSATFDVNGMADIGAGLYRVKALDSAGKVLYTSDGFTAATAGYSVVKNGHNVTISWSANSDAKSYKVVRATQENAEETITTTKNSVSMNIAPSLIHEFKIIAVIGGKDYTIAKFAVEGAKIDLNDKSDSAVNAQLLYLAEAVNRSKYDYSHSKTVIDTNLKMINNINYMEFGIMDLGAAVAGTVDLAMYFAFKDVLKGNYDIDGGYIKCYDQTAVNSLFGAIGETSDDSSVTEMTRSTFGKGSGSGRVQNILPDGKVDASYRTIQQDQEIQPANMLGQFAEIYNSNNASAWKNGFESVNMTKTNDGYKIVAVIKSEKSDSVKGTEPVYHAGLVNAISGTGVDLGMEGGKSTVKSVMGKTTLTAEIDSECRLKRYEINMPYQMDMNIVLPIDFSEIAGDGENNALVNALKNMDTIKIEVSMNMSGSQHSVSTFTRSK